jgi:peptide/nickel transport system permease protein
MTMAPGAEHVASLPGSPPSITAPPAPRARRLRRVVAPVVSLVVTLVLATFIAFMLIKLVPGDPATAIAGENATTERLAEIRDDLGLNKPFITQYGTWAWDALHGDFGTSLYSGQKVSTQVGERLPVTLQIVAVSLSFSLLVGVPIGIIAASRRNKPTDRLLTGASSLGVAVPNFWLGMILVSLFALRWNWFPATGFKGISSGPKAFLESALLPGITLGAAGAAEVARQLRSGLIEVMSTDYIRTARAKGVSRSVLIMRHAVRNAGVTMVTIVGLLVSRLVGATVVVESVFAIPGIGSLVIDAVRRRDYPVIQAVVLVLAAIVLIVNALVDIAYKRIDPRIRS